MAFLDGGFAKSIRPVLLSQSTEKTPFKATCDSIIQLMSSHNREEAIIIARLLGSTESLKARMPGVFAEMEVTVYQTLCEMWPEPAKRTSLRMVSMAAIGAMRVAKENWLREDGKHPLQDYLIESFKTLENEI